LNGIKAVAEFSLSPRISGYLGERLHRLSILISRNAEQVIIAIALNEFFTPCPVMMISGGNNIDVAVPNLPAETFVLVPAHEKGGTPRFERFT